jgi:hypothetical protein
MRLMRAEKLENCGGFTPGGQSIHSVTRAVRSFSRGVTRSVADVIIDLSRSGDFVYPAITELRLGRLFLAAGANVSPRSVDTALAELQAAGWIKQISRGRKGQDVSTYWIAPAAEWNKKHFGINDDRMGSAPELIDYRSRELPKVSTILPPENQKHTKKPRLQLAKSATSETEKPLKTSESQFAKFADKLLSKEIKKSSLVVSVLSARARARLYTEKNEFPTDQINKEHSNAKESSDSSIVDGFDSFLSFDENPNAAADQPSAFSILMQVQDQKDSAGRLELSLHADPQPFALTSLGRTESTEASSQASAPSRTGTTSSSTRSGPRSTLPTDPDARHVAICRRAAIGLLYDAVQASEVSGADARLLLAQLVKQLQAAQSIRDRLRSLALLAEILQSNRDQRRKIESGGNVQLIRSIVSLFASAFANPKGSVATSYYPKIQHRLAKYYAKRRDRFWKYPPGSILDLIANPKSCILPKIEGYDSSFTEYWETTAHQVFNYITSGDTTGLIDNYDGTATDARMLSKLRLVCGDDRLRFDHFSRPAFRTLAGALCCYYTAVMTEDPPTRVRFEAECKRQASALVSILSSECGPSWHEKQTEGTQHQQEAAKDIYSTFSSMSQEEVSTALAALKPLMPFDCDVDTLMGFQLSGQGLTARSQLAAIVATQHFKLKDPSGIDSMMTDLIFLVTCFGLDGLILKPGFNIKIGQPIMNRSGLTAEELQVSSAEEFIQRVDLSWLKQIITPALMRSGVDVNLEVLGKVETCLMGGPHMYLQSYAQEWATGKSIDLAKTGESLTSSFLWTSIPGYLVAFDPSEKELSDSIPEIVNNLRMDSKKKPRQSVAPDLFRQLKGMLNIHSEPTNQGEDEAYSRMSHLAKVIGRIDPYQRE